MANQQIPYGEASAPPDETAGGQLDQATGQPGDRATGRTTEQLRAQVAELEDRWRRAVAELDNFRKRVAGESERQRAAERARVATEWLPVLDNLDLALEHAGTDPDPVVAGVRAVRDQALAVLARLGYPRQEDVGAAFDPGRHEAVATIPGSPAPVGTVLHVVRPRYGEEERQLRPAAVVVATREQ